MKFETLVKNLYDARKPLLAVLVDPDKFNRELIVLAEQCNVSCFLVGGSKLEKGSTAFTVNQIKRISSIPVILFPGDEKQLAPRADGLLLLSLLSGRNPDYLIEKHIKAAPRIKKMKLKYLSTAYILIDGGKASTTEMVTRTAPLSPRRPQYILHTALAAEQLGFGAIYLEAGSGAKKTVAVELIRKIRKEVNIPLIVGGGIRSATQAKAVIKAGASMLVVGNALEKNIHLLPAIGGCFR